MPKSDIEIAQAAKMERISKVAKTSRDRER